MKVCQKLEGAGFTKIANVEGRNFRLAVCWTPSQSRERKSMSLERQVRIAAGALVVIGSVVGHFYNPAGYGLSAFVGAGLVFAGVTDTCGMGMIIAKMPWNRA